MRSWFAVIVLSAVLVSLATADGQQSTLVDRRSRVEAGLRGAVAVKGRPPERHAIADRMAHYHVPGVSIAVVDAGRVAWAQGYGITGDGAPVTPDTLFQAASISKPVAAMVALRLVELGTLSLDADVNTRLTRWKVPASAAAAGEPVTLRRLLSHTAGLTVHGFPGYAAGAAVPSLVQLLDGAGPTNTRPIRVDVKPGSIFRYSGGGYQVMQLLVEDVTGEPFARVANRLVLAPLGMTSSTYEQPLPAARRARAAAGHDGDGAVIPGKRHTYPEQTAAGLWTTPSDLAQVILEMQRPGRVLTRETVDTMLTLVRDEYGLGFGIVNEGGSRAFAHGGSNEGFRCQLYGHRDHGSGVVVMTNGDQGSPLVSDVLRAVSAEYGWRDTKQREVTIATVPLETLRSYEGRYLADGRVGEVTVTDGRLTLRLPGRPAISLDPLGDGAFVDREGRIPDPSFSKTPTGQMEMKVGTSIAVRQ